jgi:hypothetical protein
VNKGSLLADSSPQLMSPSHNDDLCRPLFPGGGGVDISMMTEEQRQENLGT